MEKILAFVINTDKILLLLGSDKDPQFHESFWYTITGGREKADSSLEATVRREVKEETGLNLTEIIDLNWMFEYESLGKHCIEYAFVAYTKENNVNLNEESIEYKWCDIDEFIREIKWYSDKLELKEILEKYLKQNNEK